MTQYRPMTSSSVDAIQFTGDNLSDIIDWITPHIKQDRVKNLLISYSRPVGLSTSDMDMEVHVTVALPTHTTYNLCNGGGMYLVYNSQADTVRVFTKKLFESTYEKVSS